MVHEVVRLSDKHKRWKNLKALLSGFKYSFQSDAVLRIVEVSLTVPLERDVEYININTPYTMAEVVEALGTERALEFVNEWIGDNPKFNTRIPPTISSLIANIDWSGTSKGYEYWSTLYVDWREYVRGTERSNERMVGE